MTNEGRRKFFSVTLKEFLKSRLWDKYMYLAQPHSIFIILGKLLNCLSLTSLHVNWNK